MTLFLAAQPWFGRIDDATFDRMTRGMGEDAVATVAAYRRAFPDYSPTYIASAAMSARFVRGTYLLADQQSRTASAPVYVYRLMWETPVGDGVLKSSHTLEIPLMFNNAEMSGALVGDGEDASHMAEMLSDAWIAFAKTGTPASALLPDWQPYDVEDRMVMELDVESRMISDPEKEVREIGAAGPNNF